MGVMKCGRERCPGDMCHLMLKTSNFNNYICVDCKAELDKAVDAWKLLRGPDGTWSVREIEQTVEAFMETPPGTYGPKIYPAYLADEVNKMIVNL